MFDTKEISLVWVVILKLVIADKVYWWYNHTETFSLYLIYHIYRQSDMERICMLV